MATTVHFPEKTKESLIKKFNQGAETDGLFSTEMDMQFSGVKTVHVYNLPAYPLQQYNKNVDPNKGSRYGDTKEVGDEVQTFEMGDDVSLSLSIDKGNKVDQFNMKKAGEVMENERTQVIRPYLDKYRYAKWCKDAGIHFDVGAALTNKNICDKIIDARNLVLDAGCPDDLALVIPRTNLKHIKLAAEWVSLDACGGKSLPSGSVGMFDGMAVKPSTKGKLPANVEFMVVYRGSLIAPMKIKDFKGHVDPPGMSGDLLEFRMYQDAFVIGAKAYGVLVACKSGTVCKEPGFSGTASVTVTDSDSGTIFYTTDGSDPRYSDSRKQYSSPVALEIGDTISAYVEAESKFNSNVATFTRTV